LEGRAFLGTLAGGLLAAPLVADAQPAGERAIRCQKARTASAGTNLGIALQRCTN
jgi:hypothetical protein